jgi:hypothetical protein
VLIDCDRCEMRDIACADCVVGVLMSGEHAGGDTAPENGAPAREIGEPERRALHTLAAAGLVPPLRLAVPGSAGDERAADFPDAAAEFPDAEAS